MFLAWDLEVVCICGIHNQDESTNCVNFQMTLSPVFRGSNEALTSPSALVKASFKSGMQNEYDVFVL